MKRERDRNLIVIKRFCSRATARMTRIENSLIQAHFQSSHKVTYYQYKNKIRLSFVTILHRADALVNRMSERLQTPTILS
jgi:cellobiose-specific phosphotransferase system component IIA